MNYFRRMKDEKKTQGGARPNSGPKVNPAIGKSFRFGVSLYMPEHKRIVAYYGSLTKALRFADSQIVPKKCKY